MNRYSWIAPVYGYVVCLVAVVTFLINVSGFIDAAFDRAAPLQGRGGAYGPMGGGGGSSLTSFETFRATYDERERMVTRPNDRAPVDTPSTTELRRRYEALRADRIEQMTYSASQLLVKHALLIVVAVVLFVWHWRWLRTQRDPSVA